MTDETRQNTVKTLVERGAVKQTMRRRRLRASIAPPPSH
jgi:hypothetical protein